MKKIFLAVILLANVLFGSAQGTFTLSGKINGADTGFIYLSHKDAAGAFAKDSAIIKAGNFSITGKVDGPSEAYLSLNTDPASMDDPNYMSFFIEPAEIKVDLTKDHFKDGQVTGSKTEEDNKQFKASIEPVLDRMKPVRKELEDAAKAYNEAVKGKKSEAEIDSLKYREAAIRDKFDPFQQEIAKASYQYFTDHPQSFVTLSQLRFYVNRLPLDSLDHYYANFSPEMKSSAQGKDLKKEIEQLRGGSPGSMAKDFAAADINGKQLKLSDFRGKYVLLDFWASWCVPCRKGNPHLKELYAKYHKSGIEFIGVSDDDDKPELWKKAVAKDQLPWRHVLRGLDWEKIRKNLPNERDISEKFGIHELPTKILIDRQGKIVGRFDETEEKLDERLKEIFRS